jgi:uncharacterized phage-associated protein
MPNYQPLAVANEFIRRSGEAGVTHMKLQKLVYLTLERWLASHDDSLLSEDPEVWQYGPVFSSLYHELKNNKGAEIKASQLPVTAPGVGDPDVVAAINETWANYGGMSATALSDLTHRSGTPWQQIAKEHEFVVPFGMQISQARIKKYVREKAQTLA